jgi:cytochrome P450
VGSVTDAIPLASGDEDCYYQDPARFFARLRESRPVAPLRTPDRGRAWIITRHADLRAALADQLSALIRVHDNAGDEGAADGLSGTELLSTVFQLVMAGFDTTANLIASGALALLTHPEQLARLREEPSLLPAAVEELLRFTSPVNYATDRFTTDDVPVGDVVIPAGQWVLNAITSANRDPAQFPGPDRLDLRRDTSGHVAFGYGAHYCLGAPEELRWRRVSLMNGLESLPVRLA